VESDALSATIDGGAKGQGGWAAVSASMKSKGYSRNEKQCHERYNNFLAPDLRASVDPLCATPLSAAEEKRCVAMKTENPKLDSALRFFIGGVLRTAPITVVATAGTTSRSDCGSKL
jgi:hypothetical protein